MTPGTELFEIDVFHDLLEQTREVALQTGRNARTNA